MVNLVGQEIAPDMDKKVFFNFFVPVIPEGLTQYSLNLGTIGTVYRQEDMPFTKSGIVPDLVMNAHAIPSRMTVGHVIECIQSKLAALKGEMGSSIAFDQGAKSVDEMCSELEALGYNRFGTEVMYNPYNGMKMDAAIFIGPTMYQRLKHMVQDKIHSRVTGKNEILTRQPVEGRGRDGGLRFGEMERDAVLSHGCANFLKDRLLHNSDYFEVPVCGDCGFIAIKQVIKSEETKAHTFFCQRCSSVSLTVANNVHIMSMPYTLKLLIHELQSMNIPMRLEI